MLFNFKVCHPRFVCVTNEREESVDWLHFPPSHMVCCAYWLNKLLYYCKTQWDGSYQWYRVFSQKFILTQSRYSLHLQVSHVHYHVYKIASSDYVLRHFKPINSLTLYLCKSDFGYYLLIYTYVSQMFSSLEIFKLKFVFISYLYVCCMSNPSHPSMFKYPNYMLMNE